MKKIKKLRKIVGVSLAEIATRSGIDVGRLCRAERGQARLAPHEVYLLRRLLTFAMAERDGDMKRLLREYEIAGETVPEIATATI
jgi:transcriptional regulator with XRE-family HTH domain